MTRDGAPAPDASIARSKASCDAAASMRTLVSQADVGTQPMPVSERRSSSSDSVAGALWSRSGRSSPVGAGRRVGVRSVSR